MAPLAELRQHWLDSEAVLLRDTLTAQRGNLLRSAAALDCQVSTLQRALARHPELARLRKTLRDCVTGDAPNAKPGTQSHKPGSRAKRKTG